MNTPQLNASARIMYLEALKRGIECTTFDDKQTILMKKGSSTWYTRGSRTSTQSSVGVTIADNKSLTKKILNYFHLPTATAVEVGTIGDFGQVSQLTFPVVMKPLKGAHGKDVIVGIKDLIESKRLVEKAELPVLFEEKLEGIEYRVVCVDFKFVAAAFRKPAHIVGDGEHSIQELIDKKNQHPWRGEGHSNNLSLIRVDNLVLEYLKEQNVDLAYVPSHQTEVFLRKTANLSSGGEAWDVSDEVCLENRKLFEKIATVCDLNTLGIDIMCQNLTTPIVSQTQAGVIEINGSPGLRMHHFPLQGKPQNIAGHILDMVEKTRK